MTDGLMKPIAERADKQPLGLFPNPAIACQEEMLYGLGDPVTK